MKCCTFNHFILLKETLFHMTFVRQLMGWPCVKSFSVNFLSFYSVQFFVVVHYIYCLNYSHSAWFLLFKLVTHLTMFRLFILLIFWFCVSVCNIFNLSCYFFFYSYLIILDFTYNMYMSHIYIISAADRLTGQHEMSYV